MRGAFASYAFGTENWRFLQAVRAGEEGHVLDHAENLGRLVGDRMGRDKERNGRGRGMYRHVDFAEHGDALDGVFEGDVLWSRNDDGS